MAHGTLACRRAGDRALLVDAGGWWPPALAAALREAAAGAGVAIEDVVPGAKSVLVIGPGPGAPASLQAVVHDVGGLPPVGPEAAAAGLAEVTIPVVYNGPDLAAVAGATGLSTAEVIDAHQGGSYVAAFCGFAPGFAYLTGLPEVLRLPRRPEPRPAVPAGAVAVAERYSAVYPAASPGGWHLLGRTDETLWDARRQPPALLAPGTPVRFVPARSRRRPDRLAPVVPGPAPPSQGVADRPAVPGQVAATLEILDAGMLTTVQDAGRPGRAAEGVAPSGWLDAPAARLANRLVGNPEGAAVLEATISGPSVVLDAPRASSRAVAVTGAVVPVTVDGVPVGTNAAIEVCVGARIVVGTVTAGARAYLAVSGGVAVDEVLGSRSTDLMSGLGPRPLRAGDRLPVGPDHGRRGHLGVAPVPPPPGSPVLRVLPGPGVGWLAQDALEVLAATVWTVAADSNRIGVRLEGATLAPAGGGGPAPEGMVAGAVQVPPAGRPVLFLADHPVTGGYPVLAVVVSADLHLAAQLAPGATMRFAPVPPGA